MDGPVWLRMMWASDPDLAAMNNLKVYLYNNCGTCRKAKQFLQAREVDFEEIPIREQPPTLAELERMLDSYDGDVRKLFNTSGQDYRQGNYKEKLKQMDNRQALAELATNGNLIKRPFVISNTVRRVGFKPEEWETLF